VYEERNAPRLPVVTIVRADAPRLWAAALRLVDEYVASLEVDLDFQDFQRERANLAREYGPPSGAFLMAREAELFLGCGAIRRHTDAACEMKRLYVAPSGRRRGLGRILAEALIGEARRLRYRCMLLDTLPAMQEAQALYRSLGFEATGAYRFNPVPGAGFMRLDL